MSCDKELGKIELNTHLLIDACLVVVIWKVSWWKAFYKKCFSYEISIAFLWLLVANLAISPPHFIYFDRMCCHWRCNFQNLPGLFEAVFTTNHVKVCYFFYLLTCDRNRSNFNRCGLWSLVEEWMYLFFSMAGPRTWSLVGNRWLLLRGSKCTNRGRMMWSLQRFRSPLGVVVKRSFTIMSELW